MGPAVVTGFSSFQFADDKIRALSEAQRVSRDLVVVVIPTRVPESGITSVFVPLFPLFPADALAAMKDSGMFALSEPGRLDALLSTVGLAVQHDDEIECPVVFQDTKDAVRAFTGSGPMQLAIMESGERTVSEAVRQALTPYTRPDGRVTLPAWYRAVITK